MKKQVLLTILLLQTIIFYGQKRLDRITIDTEDAEVYYNYNSNNLHTESLFYFEGEIDTRTSITYNTNNKPILIVSEINDGSFFTNEEKYEYTYNVNSQVDEILYYSWDETENNWIFEDKTAFQYNANGKIEVLNNYHSDNSLLGISNFIYDVSNKLIRIEYHDNPNDWSLISGKDEYTYDTNDNLLRILELIDENNDGNFTNDYKYDFTTYNNNFINSDLILPVFTEYYSIGDYGFNHMLTNLVESSDPDVNGNFTYSYESVFYYTDVASVENINKLSINVKPNPFKNSITFDIPYGENYSIELFDIQGKLIKTYKSKTIDTSNLSDGIYIYKIQMDNQFSTGKIIKK